MTNPYQQAKETMRKEKKDAKRNSNELRPPNLYYDYDNRMKTFHPLVMCYHGIHGFELIVE